MQYQNLKKALCEKDNTHGANHRTNTQIYTWRIQTEFQMNGREFKYDRSFKRRQIMT